MINNEDIVRDDLMDSFFEEILNEEVLELDIELKEGFTIKNDDQANFFLRRVEEFRNERDKINLMCDGELERFRNKVENYRLKETKILQNTENFFSNLLENYARESLKDSKKKSLKLPFGTLSFKKGVGKYVYDDKEILEFVKENNLEFTKTKIELDKKGFRAALEQDDNGIVRIKGGQEVPGATFEKGIETFSIK